MKQRKWTKTIALTLAMTFVLGLTPVLGTGGAVGATAATTAATSKLPAKAEVKTGVSVYKNEKAKVDASNLAEGFVILTYTGKVSKIKVQITKTSQAGSPTYTYDLKGDGTAETFPLTEGDGTYTIRVFENISGDKYAQAYSCTVTMTLRSSFLPFLYSNQYVNYAVGPKTVAKGAELVQGKTTDLQKLQAIFTFIVSEFTYDNQLAATVQSGYLPVVDKVLESKKGICFDYAAVMTAMLRSQNIPTKLVVGYAGTIYHAWISVYLENVGWVDSAIYFDGTKWTLMDPTFVSTGKGSKDVMTYVTTPSNYSAKYAY